MFGTRGVQLGYNQSRWTRNNPEFRHLLEQARREEQMVKAFTTGSALVQNEATGGQALRRQFLFNELELTGPTQSDCKLIKLMPMKDAESTLLEWSVQNTTDVGDGFVSETGSDGLFGVDFYDDPFERMSETMGFLAQGRVISDVAENVNNVMDPKKAARRGMLYSLYKNANTYAYWGDRALSGTQFNGFKAQMRTWMDVHPEDYGMYFDCGGLPLDRFLLNIACNQNLTRFGDADLLLQSTQGKADTTASLWPENRQTEGKGGNFGGVYDTFIGPGGPVTLEFDKMLKAAQPLRADGPGSDGKPRTTSTLDANSIVWVGATPFTANTAVNPGVGNFWTNFTKSTDSAALATVPALPAGSTEDMGGNNDNRLAGGTYYYAVSTVYKGFESAAYVLGAGLQASNVIAGSPTAVNVNLGQVVQLDFDLTQLTGLGSTVARSNIKWRVYRAGGPNASAPTRLSDFKFLQETGIPTGGSTTRTYDNGMYIPGADSAFLITRKKDGEDEWGWMNLLPLMQKELPILAMGLQFCLLWFTMPLMRVRRRHIYFRNVGRLR